MSISPAYIGATNTIGSEGSGGFSQNIYISETGGSNTAGTIQKMDESGNINWSFNTTNDTFIDVSKEKFVYAGDSGNNVRRLDRDGNELWVTTLGNKIRDVAEGGNNVYAAFSKEVTKLLKSDGSSVNSFSFNQSVLQIESREDGSVYVGEDADRIKKFNSSLNLQWTYNNMTGVAKGIAFKNNFVYVATGDQSVHKVDDTGSRVWKVNTISNPIGVAVDEQENVYGIQDSEILKLDSQGNQVWRTASGIDNLRDADVNRQQKPFVIVSDRDITELDDTGNQMMVIFSAGRNLNDLVIR